MKSDICWRSVMAIMPHPGNGQGNGGCKVGTVFARLACGHVKRINKSRRVDIGSSMRCSNCESVRFRAGYKGEYTIAELLP